MCGIAGFNWEAEDKIAEMCQAIAHRGPDAVRFWSADGMSLGHRRLSILDLSEKGAQPMFLDDLVVVYNGEIYNYIEIRAELIALGHCFVSDCDTEVILHAYQEWGQICVNRFNGMWAFCLFDRTRNQLFLSRDRFGIKPLYYFYDGNRFVFSSEIKAIIVHQLKLNVDKTALNQYFYQKYIGGDRSIFSEIKKLLPSHSLVLDLTSRELKTECYYQLKEQVEASKKLPLEERLSYIRETLEDAVERRLIADVPVGCFLSGGLDSSLISAIIAKKKDDFDTFSIGFKEKTYNELPFAKLVADHIHTNWHSRTFEIDDELIFKVISGLDEPFGDSSVLPTYLLSKTTRERVTVSLSGDAGDEVFGGYDSYKAYKISRLVPGFVVGAGRFLTRLLPVSDKKLSFSFKLKKFFADYDPHPQRRHLNWMSQMSDVLRAEMLGGAYIQTEVLFPVDDGDTLTDIQLNDFKNYLPDDMLRKVDIASMLCSLEARVPFLDYRLVPYVLSLPDRYKIAAGWETKALLKKIGLSFLPKEIVYRKKRGFTVPVSKWIKESALVNQVLTEASYFEHRYFERSTVLNILAEHHAKKADHSRALWLIFVFNLWWKLNLGS